MDSDHSERFARWYIKELFARLTESALVSVHDVFHSANPSSHADEGEVVLGWLETSGKELFTASPAREPTHFAAILNLRHQLGMKELIHHSQTNSMIFFRM